MDEEVMMLLDEMVNIVDALEELEKDCPKVKESKVYQAMCERRNKAQSYMQRRTKEMHQSQLSIALGAVNDRPNQDN